MSSSNLYALIIGIDRYQSKNEYGDLHAAVADANSVERFFTEKMKVPADHIVNLRNEQGSRNGILEGFGKLHEITKSMTNPVIVVYYAGHGARTAKPVGWEDWATNSDYIEMLCPSDIGVPLDPKNPGTVVEGIPDRTVCFLLNKLSESRGNNITLILDCCCSAGLNRGRDDYIPRRIQNPPPITSNCDLKMVMNSSTPRGISTSSGFSGKFQDSHVLLAACGREQQAYEINGHGLFTKQLLKALENDGILSMTYDFLLRKITMPSWQTPHSEGRNMNRTIFKVEGKRSDPFLIPAMRKKEKGAEGDFIYVLEAGSAQGIDPGSRFSIHESNILEVSGGRDRNPSIGVLSVISVEAFSSKLEHPQFRVPKMFYARRAEHAHQTIVIFCEDRAWLELAFPPSVQQQLSTVLTEDPEFASLLLTIEGDNVYFDRNDTLVKPYLGSRFPNSINRNDFDAVYQVVRGWQHFYYHLTRPGQTDFPEIRMELNYLETFEPDHDPDIPMNLRPIGENLLAHEPSRVHVQEDASYLGMTLFNDGDFPLYPFLFYFDPNDLTVVQWYTTPQGAGEGKYFRDMLDAPLLPHSSLPLGYGSGGSPWQFEFDSDDRELDIGFFKLFITASPANFSSLLQEESPFATGSRSGSLGADDSPERGVDLAPDAWGSKFATIIQQRKGK